MKVLKNGRPTEVSDHGALGMIFDVDPTIERIEIIRKERPRVVIERVEEEK